MFILRRIKKNSEIIYVLEAEGNESELQTDDELLNVWICATIMEAKFIIDAHKSK